jgi:hypothetical protein
MAKEKALFGLREDFKVSDFNRLLKPFGVRLVEKRSRDWGKKVNVTAHRIEGTAAVVVVPAADNPAVGNTAAPVMPGSYAPVLDEVGSA